MEMGVEMDDVITQGRACVRLVEAAEALLIGAGLSVVEAKVVRRARDLARTRLRQMLADLPATTTAQILMASDRHLGPSREVNLN